MGVHSLNGRVIRLSLSPILYPVALCETQNECHHALERGHIVREFTCSRLPRHSHFCVEPIECKKIDKNRKKNIGKSISGNVVKTNLVKLFCSNSF